MGNVDRDKLEKLIEDSKQSAGSERGNCQTFINTLCEALDLAKPTMTMAERMPWPKDGLEQIKLVRDILAKAPSPALPDAIASAFDGRTSPQRKQRVAQVLDTLVATGVARTGEVEGKTRYFLPR